MTCSSEHLHPDSDSINLHPHLRKVYKDQYSQQHKQNTNINNNPLILIKSILKVHMLFMLYLCIQEGLMVGITMLISLMEKVGINLMIHRYKKLVNFKQGNMDKIQMLPMELMLIYCSIEM